MQKNNAWENFESYANMKLIKFIELIKSIGFEQLYQYGQLVDVNMFTTTSYWAYNGYNITINPNSLAWWFMFKDGPKLALANQVYTRHFAPDDITLLEMHFGAELRELKLKELGI